MQEITIKDEFIKLGQALKLAGLVGSGVEAKVVIFVIMKEKNFIFMRERMCYTVIMHREKRMCWKPFTLGARQSRTREAKIRT